MIDTEALYPYEGGRRAPLRALVAAFRADFLPRDSRWEHFQEEGAVHEPTLDAEAALQVVLQPGCPRFARPRAAEASRWALAPPKPGEVEQRYAVAANVGALIGRQGATIKSIIVVGRAARPREPRRRLAARAAPPRRPRPMSECAAALLLIRGARVELTALSTTELPAAPVMAPLPPVAPATAPPPAYIQPPPAAATKRPSAAEVYAAGEAPPRPATRSPRSRRRRTTTRARRTSASRPWRRLGGGLAAQEEEEERAKRQNRYSIPALRSLRASSPLSSAPNAPVASVPALSIFAPARGRR